MLTNKKISVVVPVYKSQECVEALASRVDKSLNELDYELIMVNDCSPDGSWKEIKKAVPDLILDSFASIYGEVNIENFRFEGRNVVAREIIKKYVERILNIDEEYAPFVIRGCEKKISFSLPLEYQGGTHLINMKGIIDRVDEKDGIIRVIDYKTGRDTTTFTTIQA